MKNIEMMDLPVPNDLCGDGDSALSLRSLPLDLLRLTGTSIAIRRSLSLPVPFVIARSLWTIFLPLADFGTSLIQRLALTSVRLLFLHCLRLRGFGARFQVEV